MVCVCVGEKKNSVITCQSSRPLDTVLDPNEELKQITEKGKGQEVLWGKDQRTREGSLIHSKGQKEMEEAESQTSVSKISETVSKFYQCNKQLRHIF